MTLRPPRDDEFDAMLALMNAHQLAAFGEEDVTAHELRAWLTAPSVDVERDIRVLEQDGRLVGYVDVDPTRDELPMWWCDLKVAPDADTDAITRELVGWLEQRAQKGTLRLWTSAHDERGVTMLTRLGFTPSRHSYRMEIALEDEPRQPVWPDGVTVRTLREDEHEAVYEAVVEVWRDTSDPMDETFDEWAHWIDPDGDVRSDALVPGARGRRARGLLALPRGLDRSERRVRRDARRPAAGAPPGAG